MSQSHFIREWRKFRGITLGELAEQTGLSPAVISRIERGEQRYNQDALEAVAHALRSRPADLIARNPLEDDLEAAFSEYSPSLQKALLGVAEALHARGEAAGRGQDVVREEQNLIGSLLYENGLLPMLTAIGRSAFSEILHRRIWMAMQEILEEDGRDAIITAVDVDRRLSKEHIPHYQEAGGLAYLADLTNLAVPADAFGNAQNVVKAWLERARAGQNG